MEEWYKLNEYLSYLLFFLKFLENLKGVWLA